MASSSTCKTTRLRRPLHRRVCLRAGGGSSSEGDRGEEEPVGVAPVAEDSYIGAPVSNSENSQGSLNKRLASFAGLADSGPKDFKFLFGSRPSHTEEDISLHCSRSTHVGEEIAAVEVAGRAADKPHPERSCVRRLSEVTETGSPPTDFDFLFEERHSSKRLKDETHGAIAAPLGAVRDGIASRTEINSNSGPMQSRASALPVVCNDKVAMVGFTGRIEDGEEPPLLVQDRGVLWVRTEIAKGSDLVDGQAWIKEFQQRLAFLREQTGKTNQARSDFSLRNRVLKDMAKICRPGRRVQLATGHEVIFWYNVGAPGLPRQRVHVTGDRCPHQGVCLLDGELMEMEDLAGGVTRALSRCPRHNKAFDLCTGESPGNAEILQKFPCRFEHARWYVGVGPTAGWDPAAPGALAPAAQEAETPGTPPVVTASATWTPPRSEKPDGVAGVVAAALLLRREGSAAKRPHRPPLVSRAPHRG